MANEQETDLQKIEKREQETLKEIQTELNTIAKSYPALTDEQVGFVRARVDYLSPKHAKLFAPLFETKKKEVTKKESDKSEN